jgi:drug/metabolite transporter (DMT)-like permease
LFHDTLGDVERYLNCHHLVGGKRTATRQAPADNIGLSMFWLVPALISPLLWAASNVVDEHLVTRAEQAPVTLLLVTGIFGSLPALYVLVTGQWVPCSASTAALALAGGVLGILVYYPYLVALTTASASDVILMWNLSPVLIMGIAHVTVSERLTHGQYIAIALLVVSSMLATIAPGKVRTKRGAMPWMILASILLAVSSVAEKAVYERLPFMGGFGWLSLGAAITTAGVALASGTARNELAASVRGKLALVFIGNELLDLGAVSTLEFATSLAPVSLVHAVGGTQPVFILLIERALRRSTQGTRLERARTILATGLAVLGLGLLRS